MLCVCSLFQVIKHISTALCVHELTSTCPSKNVTGIFFILHKDLVIGQTRQRTDNEETDHWTQTTNRTENTLMESILRINEDKLLGNYIF